MRTSKDSYYLDIADSVSDRSTCLRSKYGAVIVRDDEIVSTGYNGAPRGSVNCCDRGVCKRKEMNILLVNDMSYADLCMRNRMLSYLELDLI